MKLIHVAEGGCAQFWCTACGCAHGGLPGWTWNGDQEKPTISPSFMVKWTKTDSNDPLVGVDIVCHVVVADGVLNYQVDSNHAMAGQQVPMEPF